MNTFECLKVSMEQVQNFKREGFHFQYTQVKNKYDLINFLHKEAKNVLKAQMKSHYEMHPDSSWKYHFEVKVRFDKIEEGEKVRVTDTWFNTTTTTLHHLTELKQLLLKNFQEIENKFDAFVFQGSGYIFDQILKLTLTVARFIPLSGGSKTHLLPSDVLKKHGAIDLGFRSEKDRCFLQCINRFCARNDIDRDIDASNLTFPTSLSQIPLFEKRNKFSVNVFGWQPQERRLCVYYLSKQRDNTCIDLFLYKDHFYLINDLSALIGSRWHSRRHKKFVCRSCLCFYYTVKSLKQHQRFCHNKGQVYTYPEKPHNKLKFTQYSAMIEADNVIYYDFESMMHQEMETRHKHVPIAVSAIRVCVNPKFNSKVFCYVGRDCVKQFLDWLMKQKEVVDEICWKHDEPIHMSLADWKRFERQTKCEMCGVEFSTSIAKNRDHSHYSGGYRLCLCNTCNLTHAKRSYEIPVLSHNAMRYDFKLLLEDLVKISSKRQGVSRLNIIPKNKEQFMVVKFGRFCFLDSYLFLSASLADLVESKKSTCFPLVERHFGKKRAQLLTRKGVFCYEHITSLDCLDVRELPPPDCFFDKLKNKPISQQDYEYAQKIWDIFECKTLRDYMVTYLISDVLFLGDCYQEFRKLTMKTFSLDPVKFFSTPHLSFQCMLKYSKVELDLLDCPDMINMVLRGIRGGVASIMNRYAEANYSEDDRRSEIAYFDCTGMYAYCLSQKLPVGDFQWLKEKEVAEFDVMQMNPEGEVGFVLEVDLECPPHLHWELNDFPLAPVHMQVAPSMWSEYMHDIAISIGMPPRVSAEKLVPHLGPRRHYVVHFRNLQFYLEMGLVLKKIHRIFSFTQRDFMKGFIQFHVNERKVAKTQFVSNYHKLGCNSVYGKTLESPINRSSVKMVNNETAFHKLTRKPTFKSMSILNPHLATIEMRKTQLKLNKPFIVGFTVLELAKLHLYKFHYGYIKALYGDKSRLLFTDTDSVTYHIKGAHVNQDMLLHKELFDLSNFPPDSPYYCTENKKKLGTYKREDAADNVVQYVGLRAKMYSLKYASQKEDKRAKGIKKSVVNSIRHEKFLEMLQHPTKEEKVSYYTIRSKKHNLFTQQEEKKSLSAFDDKRHYLSNTDSLAHNHFAIPH